MPPTDEAVRLARLQALFYIATGIWPLVSMRSFEAVTGAKVDRWLVKTVGALVALIGCALGLASRRQLAPELVLVATASAAVLATIDSGYVAKRRISPVYLLDAVAEIGLVTGWARLWWQSPAEPLGDRLLAIGYQSETARRQDGKTARRRGRE